MRAYKRRLRYVSIDTQSSEKNADITPSTEKQVAFSWLLHFEMQDLGMKRVHTDPCGYTYGFLPASPGWEDEPVIGLIAHIDTAPDFTGTGVRPQLHGRCLHQYAESICLRRASAFVKGGRAAGVLYASEPVNL